MEIQLSHLVLASIGWTSILILAVVASIFTVSSKFDAFGTKFKQKIDTLENKFNRRFESMDRKFESIDSKVVVLNNTVAWPVGFKSTWPLYN